MEDTEACVQEKWKEILEKYKFSLYPVKFDMNYVIPPGIPPDPTKAPGDFSKALLAYYDYFLGK
jgi:hypothetical protein